MTSTVKLIEAAVLEINAGDHDSFGTLRVVGDGDRWVQYTPGMVNVAYPFDDPPTERLVSFSFTDVEEWTPGASAMIEIFLPEPDLAAWIDRYFKEVLGCPADYQLSWKREQ
jgi:hypothetical protein